MAATVFLMWSGMDPAWAWASASVFDEDGELLPSPDGSRFPFQSGVPITPASTGATLRTEMEAVVVAAFELEAPPVVQWVFR